MMLTLSQHLEPRLELKQKLSLQQQLAHQLRLENSQAMLAIGLAAALHGHRYEPNGRCPKCKHKMKLIEILRGFNEYPLDRTTECPICHERFNCQLVSYYSSARIELPFFCASQTLWFFRTTENLALLTPMEIERAHQAYFHSAIAHFGTLTAAFRREGISYTFAELPKEELLRRRLKPFFGKVPDTTISSLSGITLIKIRNWRNKARIAPYKKRKPQT